jgi:hypothetical protein
VPIRFPVRIVGPGLQARIGAKCGSRDLAADAGERLIYKITYVIGDHMGRRAIYKLLKIMVGPSRFELGTSCTPNKLSKRDLLGQTLDG